MPKRQPGPLSAPLEEAQKVFRQRGGILRTSAALRAGIHPRTLYAMRDRGLLEPLSRGLYRLADAPALSHPDLVTVALKVPHGVICLISALAYHELATQIPHAVDLAIARDAEPPRLDYPPLHVVRFSGQAFTEGVERHCLDGIVVCIYSPEKTLADCFKYRNQIGLDTVLEALRRYRERKPVKADALVYFATVCRVARVMRPYLEALL
jgi:predicted transcriptional regulator of viral defense system